MLIHGVIVVMAIVAMSSGADIGGVDRVGVDACSDVAQCAIDKCVDFVGLIQAVVRDDMKIKMDSLLQYANFDCMLASNCVTDCNRCPPCRYIYNGAVMKSKGLTSPSASTASKASDSCVHLESCIGGCMKEASSSNSKTALTDCIRRNGCVYDCFRSDCSRCRLVVKRVFVTFCTKRRINDIIQYEGDCSQLWTEAIKSVDDVMRHRNK